MYDLHLFGGASLAGPEGVICGAVVQRRRMALLALLAASPRGAISREKAAAYLCPECALGHSRRHLKDAIYGVRHGLGRDVLLAAGDEIVLNPGLVRSDLQLFREALERGELEAAVSAYSGPFLDGFSLPDAPEFVHWMDEQRSYWARACGRALGSLAQGRAAAGDAAGAAAWWSRLAAQEPYSSRVALELMRALAAAGDRSAALHHARAYEQTVRDALGVEPDPEVSALVERLREGQPEIPAGAATPATGARASARGCRPAGTALDPVHILGITGSLRSACAHTALLAAAASLAPPAVRVELFTELDRLPFFNPDLDGDGMRPPARVADFRRRVLAADALLVCSPEYAQGIPGGLKNALDWLVSVPELAGKPFGLLLGSARSSHVQASLSQTLRALALAAVPAASVTVPVVGRDLDAARIAEDAELAAAVRGALDALVPAAREYRERPLAGLEPSCRSPALAAQR